MAQEAMEEAGWGLMRVGGAASLRSCLIDRIMAAVLYVEASATDVA